MRGPCFFILVCALGCGGDPGVAAHIAFQAHAVVACNAGDPPLKARLQASGVDGFCPLQVGGDRMVTGTCFDVPAKAVRAFRLIYYATYDRDYELAVAAQTLDLTDETRKTVVLDFPADSLDTNRDDDGDGFINLVEFCCGSHPGINAETCP